MLKTQRVIENAIVSFNFEDPEDVGFRSQVEFGNIKYSQIHGGKDHTNFYSNFGGDYWGLLIDDFTYNTEDMTSGQGAKIAIIDTSTVSIKLPRYVWENVLVSMQHDANKNYEVKSY